MEGQSTQDDKNLIKSFENRKTNLEYIDFIIETITKHKDEIKGIVIGMEIPYSTFRAWQGGVNTCYGITQRLKANLESNMGEFEFIAGNEDWSEEWD